jgi:hypothetical protein
MNWGRRLKISTALNPKKKRQKLTFLPDRGVNSNRQYLRACFPTARLPTARYFGWRLGGVTFNLRLAGQFLCAVPKMHAVG